MKAPISHVSWLQLVLKEPEESWTRTVKWETSMGENFRKLVENKVFMEETFADCSLVPPKDTTTPNFEEKTFQNSHITTKFAKFSPSKVSLYMVLSPVTMHWICIPFVIAFLLYTLIQSLLYNLSLRVACFEG